MALAPARGADADDLLTFSQPLVPPKWARALCQGVVPMVLPGLSVMC
jgi:hypothetical protein